MEEVAEADGFRYVFHGVPSIGGRYSALSDFGMVPAAVMGLDVPRFLDSAEVMVHSCSSCAPIEDNPGAVLGTVLGTLATRGHDKVTIVASPLIGDLGAWSEQLLAESTGKNGKGLIPVDQERLGPPEVYGNDRVFVYVKLDAAPDASQDAAVDRLEKAGQPVVRISVADVYDLGREFFRWEFATAVAGSILGRSEEHTSELQSLAYLVCRLLLEKKKKTTISSMERLRFGEPLKTALCSGVPTAF